MNKVSKITAFVVACAGVFTSEVAQSQTINRVVGLGGYIVYSASNPPPGYGAGMSFYTAVWPLSEDSLSNFQFGLAGSWILPDNKDNTTTALAPPGSRARRSFPNNGPTWDYLFQTLEGGVGYWNLNHYSNGQPKFSMNSTPQCYDYEVATPGWDFFYNSQALPDNRLGIAQLSNRILIPPDAMPFAGNPNGEFLGYSYMALPFTDAVPANLPAGEPPTGDQSWTCFLNSSNFKGPIAFFIPETWSKIGKVYDYPFIHGRGLDARAGIATAGAMEIGQVPGLESVDSQGVKYCKLPKLQFPVDELSRTLLVQDVTFYSKSALFNSFKVWRDGGEECSGIFNSTGAWKSTLSREGPIYTQNSKGVSGVENVFDTKVYPGNVWGLDWKSSAISPKGIFPQYFKEINGQRVPIPASSVPSETGLLNAQFPKKQRDQAYTSPTTGDTWAPQGRVGPFTTYLLDGSKVTYYWYRFIDQPSFKQHTWSAQKRAALQAHVEKIHTSWPTNRDYMAPPTTGVLATMDPSLLVTPPQGLEVGYVPIVTRQEDIGDTTPPTPNLMSFAIDPHLQGMNSVTMTATTASDAFGPVSYYFENTTTGKTSGWISSPTWTEVGLSTGTNYSYRVKARDTSLNETSWSAEVTSLPIITALSPADDAAEVALDATVTVTFGRAITTGSGFITLKNLTDGTQSQINITDTSRISIAGKVLTIDPAADLVRGKSYAIRIDSTAIKDSWNNRFGGIGNDTTWNFKMSGAGTISSGGTITYTNIDGLNPRSSPPYVGGYVVHTFSSSGALVVTTGVNVEYLLVAGGGGGGTKHGGGGGAGGLVLGSTQVTAQSYPITVGSGGAGGNSSNDELKAGIPGLNSSFGPFSAIGGGRGRTYGGAATGDGGSGGGGAGARNMAGGSAAAGQGNAGGSGSGSASGSGGGGAGQPGAKGTPSGGKGGDGIASAISGVANYYAGGGGGGGDDPVAGGSGGLGGGGHGGNNATSNGQTAGVAGSGGGGGGCRGDAVAQTGSAGGSGIVIIRYAFPAPQLVRSAIIDDKNGGPVTVNTPVTYTVTFSEDMDAASVTAADFSNAGTSAIMVESVVETVPGVFIVRVTPTSVGTLQLQVSMGAVLTNPAGNPVNTRAAILDTATLNVVIFSSPTGYVLDFTENFSGNSPGPNMTLVTSPDSPATSFNGAFTIASSPGSRIYLGTNKTDYSKADFIFEADVTIPNLTNPWSIPFIGIGKAMAVVADSCYGEPLTIPHVFMLVRNDENRLISRDNSQTALASDFSISNVPITVGTHRLRMSWLARTQIATFSIDLGNDGTYDFTFPVDGSNNGFNTTNSQLLLGGGNGVSFDNISLLVQGPSLPLKITSIIKSGTTVNVGFEGVAGLTYDLNKSPSLNFTAPNIKSTTTLTGTTLGTLQDTNATEPAAFYRVESR